MAGPLRIPVAVDAGDRLYQAEAKIYPREIDGRLQRLRRAAVFWLLGMFYLFPCLRWDGRQSVLFDLPARKFYVFGLNFWPQDFIYLSWLLVIAGLSLFFFTALAGRLWCGYACPQTVWTEVFLWMERVTEGTRNRRIRLDAEPWTRGKLMRKAAKQALWITFASWTGFTFVGFFTPVRQLAHEVASLSLGSWEIFWIGFYALATYGNAGYLREQVCKYMCPYARFQSAMFDRDTLIIAYDEGRGEPRGHRRKGALTARALGSIGASHSSPAAPLKPAPGDCVDCEACVQVCPTGIDIRAGLQYECIACGACVDACDAVMDKMRYPRGLIRYTSESALLGGKRRVLRPRVAVYALILAALVGAFAFSVAHRVPLIIDVLRDRNALFRVAVSGEVQNVYTVKLMNKDLSAHRYRIALEAPAGIALASDPGEIAAAAEQALSLTLTLRAAPGVARGRADVAFRVHSIDTPAIAYRQKSSFFAPP